MYNIGDCQPKPGFEPRPSGLRDRTSPLHNYSATKESIRFVLIYFNAACSYVDNVYLNVAYLAILSHLLHLQSFNIIFITKPLYYVKVSTVA